MPSDIAEARRAAAVARSSIDEGKTVLILAPKKEFFPSIIDQLIRRSIPYSAAVSFVPPRIKVAKLFIDWLNRPSDSFLTRLVIEHLITGGIAHVPGAKKDRRSSPATINKRIAEETVIARLWQWVDKKKDLLSVINHQTNLTPTLRTIRDSLRELRTAYLDASAGTEGEFAKQLARVSGVWAKAARFAEDISTVAQLLDREEPAGAGTVQLKTMRKAKGLEAQVVIIVGLEDDIVPSPANDLAEEGRLFYVSMTRASEKLYLLHAFKRPRDISYGPEIMRKKRSRFLDALGRASEWQASKGKG